MHYKTYHAAYGGKGGVQLLLDLEESVKKYNDNKQQPDIKMKVTAVKNLIIAISSPLMQRVSAEFQQSSEMIFIDSSGNMDRHNVRVFLLMTHTCAGGLPVGCLITTSESTETILEL